MANFIENLNMESLTETEESTIGLMNLVIQEGNPMIGYYGCPYMNYHFGDAQFIVRTILNEERQQMEVVGLDTHSSGNCVWNVKVTEMNIDRSDADKMEKRCVITKEDGTGMAVVNIVNADVLPSYAEDEIIKLQMIAFPVSIDYYPDEDAYADEQPEWHNGHKLMLAEGTIMPTGLMNNRDPDREDCGKNEALDDLVTCRGTVKALYHGQVELEGEKHNAYIRCIIETEYGDLEIVHTREQVKEEQHKNLKVGSVVSGVFVLSGDAAIYEYDQGLILDEEHHLMALRGVFSKQDPNRLRYILAEDAEYVSEHAENTYAGREEIIQRLLYVNEQVENCYAYMATIVAKENDDDLLYKDGKRCIVLAYESEKAYESIVFIDVDEENRIAKLTITNDSRYSFLVDKKPEDKRPEHQWKVPESPIEPIVMRAKFFGFIDDETEENQILADALENEWYKKNSEMLLDAMPDYADIKYYKHLFGYLFAKAMEETIAPKDKKMFGIINVGVTYRAWDVLHGEYGSNVSIEQHVTLENAMERGMQFYKDFVFFYGEEKENIKAHKEEMITALMVVQQIGKLYANKVFK